MRALFIHHSCGGQLLAAVGPSRERAPCIYETHPNGGGLRASLAAAGYEVHEASYGSVVGQSTDLFDWLPKFRDGMDRVLRIDENDRLLPDGATHDVVVFKSCFPNNDFVGEGLEPGDPSGPALTVANGKAALRALLGEFASQPRVLFVYVTAPPLAPRPPPRNALGALVDAVRRRESPDTQRARRGVWAREFDDWVAADDGWLADRPKNVAVFDYYDILTDHGASNLTRYPTGRGDDSHPSAAGNRLAAEQFLPFLNRATHRAAS